MVTLSDRLKQLAQFRNYLQCMHEFDEGLPHQFDLLLLSLRVHGSETQAFTTKLSCCHGQRQFVAICMATDLAQAHNSSMNFILFCTKHRPGNVNRNLFRGLLQRIVIKVGIPCCCLRLCVPQ